MNNRTIAVLVILAIAFMYRGEIMARVGGFSPSDSGGSWAPASIAGQGYLNDLKAASERHSR